MVPVLADSDDIGRMIALWVLVLTVGFGLAVWFAVCLWSFLFGRRGTGVNLRTKIGTVLVILVGFSLFAWTAWQSVFHASGEYDHQEDGSTAEGPRH